MLKILRPFWNMASLVCYDAPVKKDYRNNTFPMNGNDRDNGHQIEWNARFMEQINMCDVLFRGGGKKTWCFFPRQKTVDVCWEVVVGWRNFFSSCAVMSVFWLWWEIVLGVTYLPYQLCRCVFFFVTAGNSFELHRSVFWLWQEIVLVVTYLSTIPVLLLCQFFCYGGK